MCNIYVLVFIKNKWGHRECERHPVGATTMYVGEVYYLYKWPEFGLVSKYSVGTCKGGVFC